MGGNQVPPHSTDDWDAEGFDESQRAEIIEATQDGPSNGVILTDIPLGLDDPEAATAGEDDLRMVDDEIGEEDDDAELTEGNQREDEVQADFDDEDVEDEDEDDDLDETEDSALRP